jgi:hypothetical protein
MKLKFIKQFSLFEKVLDPSESVVVYHNSPSAINRIINRPIWAALNIHEAMCYYKNMINQIGESYLYKMEIKGNFFKENLEIFLNEAGIDYYDFLSDLTANPSAEEILQLDGIKLLIDKGYDGLIHNDYDPCDNNKDSDVILIFDPLSSCISINPIKNTK